MESIVTGQAVGDTAAAEPGALARLIFDGLTEGMRADVAELVTPVPLIDFIVAVVACGFKPDAYIAAWGDLAGGSLPTAYGFMHFVTAGWREHRYMPISAPGQGIADLLSLKVAERTYLGNIAQALVMSQMVGYRPRIEDAFAEASGATLQRIRAAGLAPFFILGESHGMHWNYPDLAGERWMVPVRLNCSGASARGLGSAASKLNAGPTMLAWARRHVAESPGASDPIFLKFGQVDCEFVAVFQQVRDRLRDASLYRFEALAAHSIHEYRRFIVQLAEIVGRQNLRLCSVFPPALSDEEWENGYVNAHIGFLETDSEMDALRESIRSIRVPSLVQRTMMHQRYNYELAVMAENLGIPFVDDFTPCLGPGGIVDSALIRYGRGLDHHLDYGSTRDRIVPLLRQYF